MMTRKDYIATAEIISTAIDLGYLDECGSNFMISAFAEMFQRDNERFMRERFVDACLDEMIG